MRSPAHRRASRPRLPGLAGDIVLLLAAAAVGVGVVSLAPSYPRSSLPGRPPQAEFAVIDGQGPDPGRVAWQAVPPLESSWRAAQAPGRMAGPWGRIGRWRAAGTTMVFLPTRQRPDQVLLLRYGRLTRAGVPDGTPRRMACGTASRCIQTRCSRRGVPGVCVMLGNLGYRDGPVMVVVVRWRVSGHKHGGDTESASWGFVAQGQQKPHRAGRT